MFLNEIFKVLTEGGNVSSTSPGWRGVEGDHQAEEIDLKLHNRDYMVEQLYNLLSAQNQDFEKEYGRPIWNEKLLKSREMFSGSSLQFFDIKRISTEDFLNKLKKQKVGDIDTQVDQAIGDDLTKWLGDTVGRTIGNGKLIGFNSSLSSIWRLEDPPVNVQIDYELGPYDPKTDRPTEWFAYSHSSDYDDMTAGIKGVFHKYINRALPYSQTSEKYVARVLKKSVKISDEPVVDSDYSFAVAGGQGGGLSKKYKPYINPETGEPMTKDGIPVLQLMDPSQRDYIQNLSTQFEIIYGKKPTAEERKLQNGFLGTLKLINKYLDNNQRGEVADRFLEILFGPGAQMITKDDPTRDRDIKFAAIDAMILGGDGIEPLKLQDKMSYRERAVDMAREYEEKFKSKKPTKELNEAAPNYKRVGIQHIYNPGSTAEIKDADFIELCKEIVDNGGTLEGATINLKVDGAGIRFGRDENGKPFFMTSRVDTPMYQSNIGDFEAYGVERGQDGEQLARTKLYDRALSTIVNSKFIKTLPKDTIVQAEMLFTPMGQKEDGGLKFVNIAYDPSKLGSVMTLVPITVKTFSSGATHPNSGEIKESLLNNTTKEIKIVNNTLESTSIDVQSIVNPIVKNSDALLSVLKKRGEVEGKQQAKEVLAQGKKLLSDAIYNAPIKGKDQLGSTIEGLVINMPSGRLLKVTSPEMKEKMSAKSANKSAETDNSTRTAVVAVGSFVGHRGHEQLWKLAQDKAKELGGDPYLFIGNAEGKDDPIPPSVKVQTWQKLYPEYANNISSVIKGGTILQKIKHELINPQPGKLPKYNNIVIAVGKDRENMAAQMSAALMKGVHKFSGYENVKVQPYVTERSEQAGGTGISFTSLRNALKNSSLTDDEKLKIWTQGFDSQKLGVEWIKHLMDVAGRGMGIDKNQPLDNVQESITGKTRILSYLLSPMSLVNESKRVLEEDDERSPHPEDLVFSQGIDGAKTAVKELTKLTTDTSTLEISWKGSPAVVFGRDSTGKLVFVDYQTYQKVSKDKKDFTKKISKASSDEVTDFDGKSVGELAGHFMPSLDSIISKDMKNAYWVGEILWDDIPPVEHNKYKIESGTTTYYVRADSEIGEEVNNGTIGGIALKGYIPGAGRSIRPASMKKLTSSNGVCFLSGTLSSKPKITVNPSILKQTQSSILKHSSTINKFISELKDKEVYTVFKRAALTTIDRLVKSDDLNSYIIPEFIKTLEQQATPAEADSLLGKNQDGWLYQISGGQHGVEAIWKLWADIVTLKTHIKRQVDAQEYSGDVQAVTSGLDAHESYVFGADKEWELKDRLGLNMFKSSAQEEKPVKGKRAVFCLARANPPTVGAIRMMLRVAKIPSYDPYIFFDNEQSGEEPLLPSLRLRYIKKYLKKNVSLEYMKKYFQEGNYNSETDIMNFLYDQGYREFLAVVPPPPFGDPIYRNLKSWVDDRQAETGKKDIVLKRASLSNLNKPPMAKQILRAADRGDKKTFYQLTGFDDTITVDNVSLYDATRAAMGRTAGQPTVQPTVQPTAPVPTQPTPQPAAPAQPVPQVASEGIIPICEEWQQHYNHWIDTLINSQSNLTEQRRHGKVRNSHKRASTGIITMRDNGGYDRLYNLNRIMMAAAMSDGTGAAVEMDEDSWVEKYNSAHPYTEMEYNMLKSAFKTIDNEHYIDVPFKKSQEPEFVYTTSPIICHTTHQNSVTMESASSGATSSGSIATVANPKNKPPKKQKPSDNALDNYANIFTGIQKRVTNESKYTFAGQDPMSFQSPNGGTPTMLVVTEQGSRYLITDDGMVLRNKSFHANTGGEDQGMKNWHQAIEFYAPEDVGGTTFPQAVAKAVEKRLPVALSSTKDGKRALVINDGKDWRIAKISDVFKNVASDDAPIIGTYSKTPKLKWNVLDFDVNPNGTLKSVHPGSPVTHGVKL